VGVRSPVALALGLASVTALTGAHADLALGASSPDIVSGWHDRPWVAVAARARETVEAVRSILAGERAAYAGAQSALTVRSRRASQATGLQGRAG
jgi:alkanesulfonate monooxygenase SsuD/methylene tetrahydromethanopterin reductase-like flavin-dependent oxidoreductase (luciferase family)